MDTETSSSIRDILSENCLTILVMGFILGAVALISMDFAKVTSEPKKEVVIKTEDDLDVVEYQGCEYLYTRRSDNYPEIMIHKGNCKNPIHYHEQSAERR